jgi:hypothetical protein
MKILAEFPHLVKLHLQNVPITDEGLQHLNGLRYLELLNVSGTNISNKSLEEIAGWKSLKKLYIYNTSVEAAAIQSLQKANSQLEVFNTALDLTDSLYYAQLTVPVVKIDSEFFRTRALVEVKPSRGKVNFYYTLDGTEPTSGSSRYTEPFEVRKTAPLKIMAKMQGWADSKVAIYPLVKVGNMPDVIALKNKFEPKLSAKTDSVLVDGKAGSLDRGDKAYLAFVKQDFDVILHTKTSANISQVALSFLQDVNQAVLPPIDVEVWGGMEKDKMKKLGQMSLSPAKNSSAEKGLVAIDFTERELRFVRLKAKNAGVLPPNHPLAKEKKATLYIDEVTLN